jgi:hypothetical protein
VLPTPPKNEIVTVPKVELSYAVKYASLNNIVFVLEYCASPVNPVNPTVIFDPKPVGPVAPCAPCAPGAPGAPGGPGGPRGDTTQHLLAPK